jgi:hypothetical protein
VTFFPLEGDELVCAFELFFPVTVEKMVQLFALRGLFVPDTVLVGAG